MGRRNFLGKILWRDRLARLRAYHKVRFTQGEKPIFDFINDLTQRTFLLPPSFFKGFVPEGYEASLVRVFRQKLLRTTLDSDLASGVMMMKAGSQALYLARLPAEWRKELSDNGLKIHALSQIFWIYVMIQKLRELWEFYHSYCRFRPYVTEAPYALLIGLPPRAYAGLEQDNNDHYLNFSDWFHRRHSELNLHFVNGADRQNGLKSYAQFRSHMFPALENDALYGALRKKIFAVLIRVLVGLLSGKWHYLFVARDIMEFHYMKLVKDHDLPRRVVFTNSHYINRPLWSYYLEDRGIETGMYFYSTNTFDIELSAGNYGLIYGYNLMSWSDYYTATPEHAQFIAEVTDYPKRIHVVGAIPLEDNGRPLPAKKAATLAYFDVQPFRDAFMSYIGRPSPIYFYEASLRNLDDLVRACRKYNIQLVLKPKRDVGKRLCPRYRRLINDLACKGDIVLIDSYIAAERVAEWADAVVSQPFTSVAVSAQELGKPSIYYDGLRLYKPRQLAAQNIQVLQSADELDQWVKNIARTTVQVA